MTTLSATADRRIRVFTRVVAALATVCVVTAVALVASAVVERARWDDARGPWLDTGHLDAVRAADGITWSAERSARIALPPELRDRPIALRLSDAEALDVEAWLDDGRDDTSPRFLGFVSRRSDLPLASYADTRLWIVSTEPWSMTIMPLEATPIEEGAHGVADAVLVYSGEATSGTVSWGAVGSLYVVARTVDGYQSIVLTGGDPAEEPGGSERFSWTASPFVVIEVSAYDGIAWELELDPVPGGEATP